MLALPWWKWSGIINLPPGSWLCSPGNGLYQGLRIHLCYWQIRQWQWPQPGQPRWVKVPFTKTMHNLHPCHWGHFIRKTIGNDTGGWETRLTSTHRTGHPSHLNVKILLCWGHPWVRIHMIHKYLHNFHPFVEIYPYTSCPDFLVTTFPVVFLPSPWPSKPWPQSMSQYIIALMIISPSKASEKPSALPRLLPTSIFLHHWCRRNGLWHCRCPLCVVPACGAKPSINQIQLFSSPVSFSWGSR